MELNKVTKMDTDSLQKYARLIVRLGMHVTQGKYVILNSPIEAAELARMIAREAFECGARDVIMNWSDDAFSRLRFENAPLSEFEKLPEWRGESRNYYARQKCCYLSLVGNDPEAFAGVPSEKLRANTLASRASFKEFYRVMDQGGIRWCVAAYPGKAWAKTVFPDRSEDDAVDALWGMISTSVRIDADDKSDDIVAKWQTHDENLKRRAKALNDANFLKLHYKNSIGTDFTVGLAKGHIWKGGSEACSEGVSYFPNLPTEEIFTMPDCRVAEGRVVASMPLSYQGEKIDKFWLEFSDGRVSSYGAEVGEHALRRLLDTDEGSRRLGEVALIPFDSPISNLNILFFETLFDENASCHLALGECYPDTMVGGETLDEETLHALGGNCSANHVDFMIGTADLCITGMTADGKEIAIFENGNFVI